MLRDACEKNAFINLEFASINKTLWGQKFLSLLCDASNVARLHGNTVYVSANEAMVWDMIVVVAGLIMYAVINCPMLLISITWRTVVRIMRKPNKHIGAQNHVLNKTHWCLFARGLVRYEFSLKTIGMSVYFTKPWFLSQMPERYFFSSSVQCGLI